MGKLARYFLTPKIYTSGSGSQRHYKLPYPAAGGMRTANNRSEKGSPAALMHKNSSHKKKKNVSMKEKVTGYNFYMRGSAFSPALHERNSVLVFRFDFKFSNLQIGLMELQSPLPIKNALVQMIQRKSTNHRNGRKLHQFAAEKTGAHYNQTGTK